MKNVQYVGGLFQDTFRVQEHEHLTYELAYYTKGQGQICIEKNLLDFHPGVFFIIAPYVSHSEYGECGFQSIRLNICHPGFPVNTYLRLCDSENREIFRILFQMHSEYHRKRQNWEALVDSLYELLRQYLLSFMITNPLNTYVETVIQEILENFSNPFYEIKKTINSLPFHPNYFRELFIRETGKTPNQYLTDKRMEYAQELICTKSIFGYSFKEIALMCGYNDAYYFSRLFKQHTGESPKQWSAHHQKKPQA